MKTETLVVEVDDQNRDLYFRPLSRRVRGRFDAARAVQTNHDATALLREWPQPLPGQRIGIDPTKGEGFIEEPLQAAEHAAIREKFPKRGWTLEPERQTFPGIHVPSWLHYLKRAVESGAARLIEGKLPEKITGKPKESFVVTRVASESQATIDKLVAIMYAMLTPEQQERAAAMMQGE